MDVRHHAEARAFAHLAAEAPLPDQSNADFDETASLHEGLFACRLPVFSRGWKTDNRAVRFMTGFGSVAAATTVISPSQKRSGPRSTTFMQTRFGGESVKLRQPGRGQALPNTNVPPAGCSASTNPLCHARLKAEDMPTQSRGHGTRRTHLSSLFRLLT
jgi:hypothetical protein